MKKGNGDAASVRRKSGFTDTDKLPTGMRQPKPVSRPSSRGARHLSIGGSLRHSPRTRSEGASMKNSPRSGQNSAKSSPRYPVNPEVAEFVKKLMDRRPDSSSMRDSDNSDLLRLISKTAHFTEVCPNVLSALLKFVYLISAQDAAKASLKRVYELVRQLDSTFISDHLFKPFKSAQVHERVQQYLWVKDFLGKHSSCYFFSVKWHNDFCLAWELFQDSGQSTIEEYQKTLGEEQKHRYALTASSSNTVDMTRLKDFAKDYEAWRLGQFLHQYQYQEDAHEGQLMEQNEQALWALLVENFLDSKLIVVSDDASESTLRQEPARAQQLTMRQLLFDDTLFSSSSGDKIDPNLSEYQAAIKELVNQFKQDFAQRLTLQNHEKGNAHVTALFEHSLHSLIDDIDLDFVRRQLRHKFSSTNVHDKIQHYVWLSGFFKRLKHCQLESQSKETDHKIEQDWQKVFAQLCSLTVIPKKLQENDGCTNIKSVFTNPRVVEKILNEPDLTQFFGLNSYHLPGIGGQAGRNVYEDANGEFLKLFRQHIGHPDFIALQNNPNHVFVDPLAAKFDFCERGLPPISLYSKLGVHIADTGFDIIYDGWSGVKYICGGQDDAEFVDPSLTKIVDHIRIIGKLRHDELFREIHLEPIDSELLLKNYRVRHLMANIADDAKQAEELVEDELMRKFDDLTTGPQFLVNDGLINSMAQVIKNQPTSVKSNDQSHITQIVNAMNTIMKEGVEPLKDIAYFFETMESSTNPCDLWTAYATIVELRKHELIQRAHMTRSASALSRQPSPHSPRRQPSAPSIGMVRSVSTLELSPRTMEPDPGSVSKLQSFGGRAPQRGDVRLRASSNGGYHPKRLSGRPVDDDAVLKLLGKKPPKLTQDKSSEGVSSGDPNTATDSSDPTSLDDGQPKSSRRSKFRTNKSGGWKNSSGRIRFGSRRDRQAELAADDATSGSAEEDLTSDGGGDVQQLAGSFGSIARKTGSFLGVRKKKTSSLDGKSPSQEGSDDSAVNNSGEDSSGSQPFLSRVGIKLKEMRDSKERNSTSTSPRRAGSFLSRPSSQYGSRDSSKSGSKKGSHKKKKNSDVMGAVLPSDNWSDGEDDEVVKGTHSLFGK